jgi:hypothetical protein
MLVQCFFLENQKNPADETKFYWNWIYWSFIKYKKYIHSRYKCLSFGRNICSWEPTNVFESLEFPSYQATVSLLPCLLFPPSKLSSIPKYLCPLRSHFLTADNPGQGRPPIEQIQNTDAKTCVSRFFTVMSAWLGELKKKRILKKIVLIASEIQCFCVLFQLHPDFIQLRPGCYWNSTQNCSISKTVSTIFSRILFFNSPTHAKTSGKKLEIRVFASVFQEVFDVWQTSKYSKFIVNFLQIYALFPQSVATDCFL